MKDNQALISLGLIIAGIYIYFNPKFKSTKIEKQPNNEPITTVVVETPHKATVEPLSGEEKIEKLEKLEAENIPVEAPKDIYVQKKKSISDYY